MKKRNVAGPFLLCVCFVVCLVALTTDASAGPFRYQWSASLSASQEFDDNITLSPENREHDWITRLIPGLSVSLLTEETEANLSYELRLVNYARNDQRSEVRHFITLTGFQGIQVARRVTLDLNTVLRISEDPFELAEPDEDVSNASDTSNRSYRTTLGGRVNYLFGPEDTVYAGFLYEMLLNDDPLVEDRRQYLPSAGFSYWFTREFGVRTDYTFTKADFDQTENYDEHIVTPAFLYRFNPRSTATLSYTYDDLAYDGLSLDYVVHTITLGLDHQFNSAMSGSISGGYFVVVPEEGDDRGDFAGSLSFTYTRPRITFNLNGDAGYRRQFFQRDNLGLSLYGNVSVNLTYQATERLSANLTGGYFRDEYLETIEKRTSDNYRGGAGLDYTILRWLRGSLRYDYRQRESNRSEDEYVDNRVVLIFTATHTAEPRALY